MGRRRIRRAADGHGDAEDLAGGDEADHHLLPIGGELEHAQAAVQQHEEGMGFLVLLEHVRSLRIAHRLRLLEQPVDLLRCEAGKDRDIRHE